ncbi:MAG: endonuclease/exonuclease/phosphatase family metal-dependent hydrolase [Planctomycetota bacterium]|jgi:endonuclease/exonuclease/phosphatase family metal-dependent hydrolase
MRKRTKISLTLAAVPTLLVALFCWNGLETSWRIPESGVTKAPAAVPGDELTIMAFNLAKGFVHEGGLSFKTEAQITDWLDEVAALVVAEGVDLLFLSEVVFEAGPCPINHVVHLAEAAGFHAWAYGDFYSFGIPGYRMRSGNAILSRFPLKALEVQPLAGARRFWNPRGTRRLLWAEIELGDAEPLLVGSVRNETFIPANKPVQVREILDRLQGEGHRPVLLAGDFNDTPDSESFRLWRDSDRFQGVFDGAPTWPTWPTRAARRRIDSVLVPIAWPDLVGERVLDVKLSDHSPVVVVARLPTGGSPPPSEDRDSVSPAHGAQTER